MRIIHQIYLIIITFILINNYCIDTISSVEGTNETISLISFEEYEEEQRANVTPGENNSVYFPCTINGTYFKDKNISKIKCSLDAEIKSDWSRYYDTEQDFDQTWSIEVIPNVIEIEPSEQKEFFVIVQVPWGTSYYVVRNITVFGTVVTFPGNLTSEICNISGIIRVNQYSSVWNISSEKLSQSINKDETAICYVNVINMGNGHDFYDLYIDNAKWLAEKGFNIQLSSYSIIVAEKGSKDVEIKIKVAEDTPPGKYHIDLNVKVSGMNYLSESEKYTKHIIFTIEVKPNFSDKYFIHSVLFLIIITIIIVVKSYSILKRKKK